MEDTLRATKVTACVRDKKVLILVLMEDTLREVVMCVIMILIHVVLILVLMEDTLRGISFVA